MLSPALTVAEVLDGDLHPDFRKISWNSVFRLTCSAQWLGPIQFWKEHRLSCTFLKGIRRSLWQDLMGTVWHHDNWLPLITQIELWNCHGVLTCFDMVWWYPGTISGDGPLVLQPIFSYSFPVPLPFARDIGRSLSTQFCKVVRALPFFVVCWVFGLFT
jgi:hypothetical protein